MDPAAAMDVKNLSQMKLLRKTEAKGDSEIQQLYAGSVVFITGGTGFLGKQLVEKLLRACRGIKKIYLLSRSKKGKSMDERLEKTLKDPVFDQLRTVDPEFYKRIVLVEGDILDLKLGIKHGDWEMLTREVNFIYHVAATVLFNEPMKSAIITNVRGTREVIALARDCRNLKSIVHVSTAYSHCYRKEVEEKFYPSPMAPAAMIEMVECLEESRLVAMTPALTEGWPNTYTFSKAIAEEVVRVMGEGLPICVVRPAIVVPSQREPEPGWLDFNNVFGPNGLLLGAILGLIRIALLDLKAFPDIVPVDYVNNLIIAASWETTKRFQRGEQEVKLYTCSRVRNRISLGQLHSIFIKDGRKFVSPKAVWYPDNITTKNQRVLLFFTIIMHFIPALFIDGLLWVIGKKFRLSKIYYKVYKLNTVLSYFLLNTWDLNDDNTVELCSKLSEADKQIFHFDVTNMEHYSAMMIWYLGLRKYIIKDGLKGTEQAVKRQPVMKIVHYLVTALYFFFLWIVFSWTFTAAFFCVTCVLQFMR